MNAPTDLAAAPGGATRATDAMRPESTTRPGSTVRPGSAAPQPSRDPFTIPPGLAQRLAARALTAPGAPTFTCLTPFTGGALAQLPTSGVAEVEAAYRLARQAQPAWAATPVARRAQVLLRLHDAVLRHRDELLDLVQLESGKTRRHAFEEVLDVAGVCRHYARRGASYLRPRRRAGAIPLLTQAVELRRPKGVIGVVAPWNYPLSMSVTDALPALLAGNAVVLRPDQRASLTALRVVELLDDAGLPPGLLQVVLGDGPTVGAAVLARADYVMFTGSTPTGRVVARDAGERLVGASLELGGKNALYVAQDADLDRAAEGAERAVFGSAGQLCISIERILVHERVADAFTERFLARVRAMRVAADLGWGTDMGSLISAEQLAKVVAHVQDARDRGATVLAGGRARPDLGPWFHEPTVLTGVTREMTCYLEETFGPVVSISRVSGDEEAVARANEGDLGLNASVWTRDLRRGRALAARIEAGTVNVNEGYVAAWASYGAPMGGMRSSGIGRRHGAEGIHKYTETQNVTVQHLTGLGVPRGVPPRAWAAGTGLALRAMKSARLP